MKPIISTIIISFIFYSIVGILVFKAIDNKEEELWNLFISKDYYMPKRHLIICQFVAILFWPVFAILFLIKRAKDLRNEKRRSPKNPRDNS